MNRALLIVTLSASIFAAGYMNWKTDRYDLGGGFHTDADHRSTYFAECNASTIKLQGKGGAVSSLQLDEMDTFTGIRVVVIGNQRPTTACENGLFTITTMSSTDIVYMGSQEGFRYIIED